MVSKRDRDAESGLQVLSVLSVIWAIGFFYWSRGGNILGMDVGIWPLFCCSSINILLIVVFISAWLFTRKENRVKRYLDDHFKTANSISVDGIALEFGMKRVNAIRSLHSWMAGTTLEGDYDEKTGLFLKKESEGVSPDAGKEI